jgi:hypothetical protein
LVVLDALEEVAEEWGECERDDRDGERCEGGPEEECVPLPQPELAGEGDGVLAGGAKEFAWGKRHGRGVEDPAGQVNEGDDEDELKRVDDVIAEL